MKIRKLIIFFLLSIFVVNQTPLNAFWYFGMLPGKGWLDAVARGGKYGASPYADWNKDGHGFSRNNRYSLMWDEPVCRAIESFHVGYQPTEELNPLNPEGSFSSRISLRHAFLDFGLFREVCNSWAGGPTYYVVREQQTCALVKPIVWTCFKRVRAPYSRKTLYPWMARIYLSLRFEDAKGIKKFTESDPAGKILFQVLEGNEAFIERGYKTFEGIDMSYKRIKNWMPGIIDNSIPDYAKRYMSETPGRDMICARAIRTQGVGHEGHLDTCNYGDDCLKDETLYKLIKCVLVPLGPPPPPFTPYIVGNAKLYSVYSKQSTYERPVVRISYIKDDIRKFQDCTGLNNGTNSCDMDTYQVEINVKESEICTKLTKSGDKTVNYSLGCQDRGIPMIPKLESVPPISSTSAHSALKIISEPSGTILGTIDPIDSSKYDMLYNPTNTLKDKVDYIKTGDNFLTAFQAGFKRHPKTVNSNIDSSLKRLCQILVSDSDSLREYTNLETPCESLPSMMDKINTMIYECEVNTVSGQKPSYVEIPGTCISVHGLANKSTPPVLGRKCRNGDLIPIGDTCTDMVSSVFYEHDTNGKSICLRGYPSNSKHFFVLRTDPANPTGPKKTLRFFEAEKVLMPLDSSGNIDFSKQPFFSLNSLTQDELDYFERSGDAFYIYKKDDITTNYAYGPKKFLLNTSTAGTEPVTTEYLDYKGRPFLIEGNEQIHDDFNVREMCVPTGYTPPSAGNWKYTLQMPGYYANYNFMLPTTDIELNPIKAKLTKIAGGVKISDVVNNPATLDKSQKDVLLIPNKLNPSATPKIGIIDEITNRLANLTKVQTGFKANIGSFNFYPDYFKEIVELGKISYIDGTDLTQSIPLTNNLFDTSKCDTIDFEMWGGGGNSHAKLGSTTSLFDFTTVAHSQTPICNINSAGQNGSYVKGRFNIRYNTRIRILVGNAAGSDTSTPYSTPETSSSIKNLSDLRHSDIWITDPIDDHIKIVSTDYTKNTHECESNDNCKDMEEDKLTKSSIDNNVNIVEKDNTTLTKLARYISNTNEVHSLVKVLSPELLNENDVEIKQYRGISTSSYCGTTLINGKSDLFATIPLSYPVNVNEYNPNSDPTNYLGYNIKKTLPNFLKSSGTGDFNDIGSYFFINISPSESTSGTPFGFGINWLTRTVTERKSTKCESRIKACFALKNSPISGNQMIYGGNASAVVGNDLSAFEKILSETTIDPGTLENLVTDMNLHCPGLGGCYESSATHGISQPGTHGLVKIECSQS